MKGVLAVAAVMAAALVAGQLTLQQAKGPLPAQEQGSKSGLVRVAAVLDGDTVALDTGERVRMIGIDTPETHDNPKLSRDVKKRGSSKQAQLAMGQRAARHVRSFLEGRQVKIEFDVQTHDRYGRLLAYLYLEDGTFVNAKIVADGYAYPLTIPPNVRYAERFVALFNESRNNKRGLWQ